MDTDHISIYQRQSGPEYAALSRRIAQHSPGDVVLSVVSFHEQALGGHNYIQRSHTAAQVIHGYSMLNRLPQDYTKALVLPFDTAAATMFNAWPAGACAWARWTCGSRPSPCRAG
jgi:tRNA(fMet)-specific endonuclease VapC